MLAFLSALPMLVAPRARSGQGLVEYALIIVLIAVAVIAMITLLGGQVGNVYSRIITSLN
jgi:pilus assembly protein Flp/PilA